MSAQDMMQNVDTDKVLGWLKDNMTPTLFAAGEKHNLNAAEVCYGFIVALKSFMVSNQYDHQSVLDVIQVFLEKITDTPVVMMPAGSAAGADFEVETIPIPTDGKNTLQ